MIYLLKFLASFVLPPGIFFLLLLLLAIYCWRRRQQYMAGALAAVLLVFYFLSTSLVAEQLLGSLEDRYAPPAKPAGDVIVMLGGGALPDTPDVDGFGTLCSSPSARLLTAVRLHRQLQLPILLSGGQVYEDSGQEAQIARRVLLGLGVDEADILVEDRSLNTRQNAELSAQILREHGFSRPILVTSAFHMERAMLNFEKASLAAVPYPADYMVNRRHVFHYMKLAPSASALSGSVIFLQEKLRSFVTRHFE